MAAISAVWPVRTLSFAFPQLGAFPDPLFFGLGSR